jgi:threonine/homoserine/homoserine lactone efflux protein
LADLVAFLAVAAVVIVTPGPDTALTIRNTLGAGRSGGLFTAIGVAAGQTTWAVVTSAGLAALLLATEPIFRTVRYVGAAYLVFLGLQTLASTFRRREDERIAVQARPRPWTPFRQGLLSNLTNPKMVAFFPALLPQFATSFAGLLTLGLLFAAMTLTWLSVYVLVVAKAGDVVRSGPVRRAIETVTGIVLVVLGGRLATDRS